MSAKTGHALNKSTISEAYKTGFGRICNTARPNPSQTWPKQAKNSIWMLFQKNLAGFLQPKCNLKTTKRLCCSICGIDMLACQMQ